MKIPRRFRRNLARRRVGLPYFGSFLPRRPVARVIFAGAWGPTIHPVFYRDRCTWPPGYRPSLYFFEGAYPSREEAEDAAKLIRALSN